MTEQQSTCDLKSILKLLESWSLKVFRKKREKKNLSHLCRASFFCFALSGLSTFHPNHIDPWTIIYINRKSHGGGTMINLFLLLNHSVILVHEDIWRIFHMHFNGGGHTLCSSSSFFFFPCFYFFFFSSSF